MKPSIDKTNSKSIFVAGIIIIVTILVSVFINELDSNQFPNQLVRANINYEKGKVISIKEETLEKSVYDESALAGEQKLEVQMLTGEHKGETVTASNYLNTYNSVLAKTGQTLIFIVDSFDTGKFQVRVYNYCREQTIYFLCIIFLGCMILIGRRKGLMSGLSLIYTFFCILTIYLPLLTRGYSPIWAVIAVAILITVASMILLNGIGKKSFCSIMGTSCGVVLAGILHYFFAQMLHVSGFHDEEAESLMLISQTTGLQVKNLLFAGILIASLGAVMDVAVSIVSAMNELHTKLPKLRRMELFSAAMNIGKDMIGTMSNTLILAFAGSSLSMLVILQSYSVQHNQWINMNVIAIEVAQALSASLAVVLTVPITAAITAAILKLK